MGADDVEYRVAGLSCLDLRLDRKVDLVQHLSERRNLFALSGVESLDLGERHRRYRPVPVGCPLDIGVVQDHQVFVTGKAQIEFDAVGAFGHRPPEGTKSVLRFEPQGAAVSDEGEGHGWPTCFAEIDARTFVPAGDELLTGPR